MATWADGTLTSRSGSALETSLRSYTDIKVGPVRGVAPAPSGSEESAAIQAVWDSCDELVLREGTYKIGTALAPNADGKMISGAGRNRTYLQQNSDNTVINWSGTGSTYANHRHFNKAADFSVLGLSNTSYTRPLMQMIYCDNLSLYDINFFSTYAPAILGVEWWDSHMYGIVMDGCGGAASNITPSLYLPDKTASGLGSGTVSDSNQLNWYGLRIESWRNGAMSIGTGQGWPPRDVHFYGLKTETFSARYHAIRLQTTKGLRIRDWYCYLGALDSGASAVSALYATSAIDTEIALNFGCSSTSGVVDNIFDWEGGNQSVSVHHTSLNLEASIAGAVNKFRNGSNSVRFMTPPRFTDGSATMFDGASNSIIQWLGTGSPEGVIPAQIGSLYYRGDGGAGTSLYVKESGTSSTGWVAK